MNERRTHWGGIFKANHPYPNSEELSMDEYDMDLQDWFVESLEDYPVCDEHTIPVNVVVRQDHFEREYGILF